MNPAGKVDGIDTYTAFGYEIGAQEGYEWRTREGDEWSRDPMDAQTLYQVRRFRLAPPGLVDEPGTYVTTISSLVDRPDKNEWFWMNDKGQWIPLTAYPFHARMHPPNYPLRVKPAPHD